MNQRFARIKLRLPPIHSGEEFNLLNTEDSSRKFAYFLLGIALPFAGYLLWSKTIRQRLQHKAHREELQELAVVDSFPASDPPATW